jgi:hypothetical protein
MPVIRGQPNKIAVEPEARARLLEKLKKELQGESTSNGPIIFEIPFNEMDRFDVLIVWDEWGKLRSEDRTNLILDAYGERQFQIVQALGLTMDQAIEEGRLPYRLECNNPGTSSVSEIHEAMIALGGFSFNDKKVELRVPSFGIAQEIQRKLGSRLPGSQWGIGVTVHAQPGY